MRVKTLLHPTRRRSERTVTPWTALRPLIARADCLAEAAAQAWVDAFAAKPGPRQDVQLRAAIEASDAAEAADLAIESAAAAIAAGGAREDAGWTTVREERSVLHAALYAPPDQAAGAAQAARELADSPVPDGMRYIQAAAAQKTRRLAAVAAGLAEARAQRRAV